MGEEKKIASALRYRQDDDVAPKILAKGVGIVADNILDAAKENEIPIYEQPELARQLNRLEIGDEIPEALYEVVAEVLVFIAQVDKNEK